MAAIRPALRQAAPLGTPWPHYYTAGGMTVEVDLDEMEWDPDTQRYGAGLPAAVTIIDRENTTGYYVVAREDEDDYARLLSLSMWVEDPDGEGPGPFLHQRSRKSDTWLARVAIECVRGVPVVHDSSSGNDELLLYVASVARKCAREAESAERLLSGRLGVSLSTVNRLRQKAVAAGYLDAHQGGRPRKSSTPKETPSA